MKNRIQMLSDERFLSHQLGAEVYYDSRHQIARRRFTGAGHGELMKGLQPEGTHRNQILLVRTFIVEIASTASPLRSFWFGRSIWENDETEDTGNSSIRDQLAEPIDHETLPFHCSEQRSGNRDSRIKCSSGHRARFTQYG